MPDIKSLFEAHQQAIADAERAAQKVVDTRDALAKGCTENAAGLGGAIADTLGARNPQP